jgi:DNA-nicking Smr family endonuclease
MPKNHPHPKEPRNARAAASAQKAATKAPEAPTKPNIKPGSGLAGLSALRDALKREALRSERQRAIATETKRTADADAALFRHQLGEVTPLAVKTRATITRTPPAPLPLQTRLDEEAVLNEAISDEFDPEMLLDTDESLFYCRPGMNEEVVRKLRRGAWIVQAQLDMHGMRREEAREALAEFIRESSKRGLRCLRVIHGKGLGSVGKEPVLKGKVRAWLVQKEEVIAFCQARPNDGGAGAVLVLLQPGSLVTQPKP